MPTAQQRVVVQAIQRAICLLAACAIPPSVCAEQAFDITDLVVERFGSERGLSIRNVTSIHQDHAGLLWIGTREGLVMYDGHSATTFEHEIGNPSSISDNYVRTVYEDSSRNLWIGTNSSGLNRLDRATWTFEHFRHDSSEPTSISHDSVNTLLEGRDGSLWVATQIGLNRFDEQTGTFERLLADPDDPNSLSHDYVYALCEDRDGALWVGTVGGGLNRLDPQSLTFSQLRHDPDDPSSLLSDRVFALAEGEDGVLWIGTQEGLVRFDPDTSRLESFLADPNSSSGLPYPLVTSLAIDGDQTLWVGTWGGGVARIDTRSRQFLNRPARVAPVLESERITALTVDHAGAIWVGTWSKGVLRSRRPAVWSSMLTEADDLSFRDATSVLEDRNGDLWVGTWGSGLNVRRSGELRFDRSFNRSLGPLSSGTVLSLVDAPDGGVWAGTMGPLFRVEAGGTARFFAHDPSKPGSLGDGYVTAVLLDSDDDLWVGVGGSGLYRYREETGDFEAFVHDPNDESSLSDDYVTDLVEDHEGLLWVSTRSGGVNVLDRSTGRAIRLMPDSENPQSLSYHFVTSLAVDDEGTVWIATAGGGLNAARRSQDGTYTFDRLTEQDGLIDDTIRSVVADGSTIWLATAHGLARFETGTQTLSSFDSSDGLPVSGFNGAASWAGRENLYFGTSNGLLVVPRGLPSVSAPMSRTILRAVQTLDGPVAATRPAWELESLELPYGEIVSFSFAVLDYSDSRRHRHAYRLAGLRNDWIQIGERREVTFTDLDPGEYTLELRGRNAHGIWSDATSSLRLVIVPPFWMTTWFRLMMLGLFGLAILVVHRWRTSTLEKRNRELVTLKNAREEALAESQASREQLHDAYARLRRLTRRLEAAKEDERKRIARELHDEMGQGLTAAKINLQLLSSIPATDEGQERAADTIELVDRMIQHVRALSLDLRPPLLDELGLEPALRSYLEAQAQRAGLEIEVEAKGLSRDLPAEICISAFRFVQEAVTNVIRHAKASSVKVRIVDSESRLSLSVQDDGCGFDVRMALDRSIGGQHLGLLGLRERAESLGGQLEIDSLPGRGALLAAHFPRVER